MTLAAPPDKGTVRLVIGTTASNDQIKECVVAHEQAATLGADGYCISADPAGTDWKNLVDSLDSTKQPPAWFTGFEVGLAPKHGSAKMSAEDRDYYNKAGRPLMVFPEISMWGNHADMLVNKEYWKQLQDEWNSYSPDLMKGGWVSSERWNTDVACIAFLSWYWNPRMSVDEVLDEYASFTFGAEAATARQLLELLDDANQDRDRKAKIRTTVAALDASLPAWAKRDWRWQEIVTSCNRFK